MSIRVMSLIWDCDLPTSEKMVLLVIADHADDFGKNAWPSMRTIARKASMSERQAQRYVKSLVDRQILWCESQAGGLWDTRPDRRPNRYSINFNGVSSVSPRKDDRVTPRVERGDIQGSNGVSPVSPKPSLEPSENNVYEQGFEKFWQLYPRKVAKGAARRAWLKATKTSDIDTIIEGVTRYAHSRGDETKQYTPYPATWLNSERWLDDEHSDESIEDETPKIAWKPCGKCQNGWLEMIDERGYESLYACECKKVSV